MLIWYSASITFQLRQVQITDIYHFCRFHLLRDICCCCCCISSTVCTPYSSLCFIYHPFSPENVFSLFRFYCCCCCITRRALLEKFAKIFGFFVEESLLACWLYLGLSQGTTRFLAQVFPN